MKKDRALLLNRSKVNGAYSVFAASITFFVIILFILLCHTVSRLVVCRMGRCKPVLSCHKLDRRRVLRCLYDRNVILTCLQTRQYFQKRRAVSFVLSKYLKFLTKRHSGSFLALLSEGLVLGDPSRRVRSGLADFIADYFIRSRVESIRVALGFKINI